MTRPGIRSLTRSVAVSVAAVVLTGLGLVPAATPAAAGTFAPRFTTFDSRLLADINHARAAHGLRALTAVAGTTDVAHGWSCHLAVARVLVHNLSLGRALETHGSYLWSTYGENIARESSTASADALFRKYMASPPHRANILDRSFRYVGLWSKIGGGTRYNTIDFVGSTASSYRTSYGSTRRTC